MTYTDLNLSARASVKDIKSAPERTKLYARLAQRTHGMTASEMKEAVHREFPEVAHLGFTPHNSYSLQLLANTYGFDFISIDYIDEGKLDGRRYFFRSVKNADKFDAARKEQSAATRAVAKATPRGARKVAKVPMPVIANASAKASRKVAKASQANASLASTLTGAKA